MFDTLMFIVLYLGALVLLGFLSFLGIRRLIAKFFKTRQIITRASLEITVKLTMVFAVYIVAFVALIQLFDGSLFGVIFAVAVAYGVSYGIFRLVFSLLPGLYIDNGFVLLNSYRTYLINVNDLKGSLDAGRFLQVEFINQEGKNVLKVLRIFGKAQISEMAERINDTKK